MVCSIRDIQKKDIPALLEMIHALAKYEKLDHKVKATASELEVYLFGDPTYAKAILIEEGQIAVGFALYFYSFSTFLGKPGIYLEDLFVQTEFRGKGYGQKLLQHLAKKAQNQNCGRLEWSVLDWNQPAIDFYTRRGAEAMQDWTVYRLEGDDLERFANGV